MMCLQRTPALVVVYHVLQSTVCLSAVAALEADGLVMCTEEGRRVSPTGSSSSASSDDASDSSSAATASSSSW